MERHLVKYVPPAWARDLKYVPKYRVELAVGTTPVHEWTLPGVPEEFKVGIKRHDMTGSTLSGNKAEKLEFVLADAIATGCKHVLACGNSSSNLCRAMVLACRQVGLVPHIFIMSDIKKPSELDCRGNLLLDRLSGANMYIVPMPEDEALEVYPRMAALAKKILVHAFMVTYNEEYAHRHVNQELRNLSLDDVRSEDILDITDGYLQGGYSLASQEQLEFMVDVSTRTGVVLDTTFTGKAAWGMVQEMRHNPGRFKGRRVLFIHTGGMLGLFDGRMDEMLMKPGATTNNVTMWSEDVINDKL